VNTLPFARLFVVSALAALPIVTASSCMAPAQRRQDSLMKSAREFNDGLRWGRDQDVAPCLTTAEALALATRKADLGEDFVMADEEVKSIQIVPGAEKATVVAEFTWYNLRRALVRKSTVEQKWEWIDGRWLVTEQRRTHGDRFPLVPERLEAKR
jgi:hypothetical protein